MKYLASVSYDGAKFYGFQRLDKKKSVQAELEKALSKINKTMVSVKGAGRTDRGVHALDQKVHFDLTVDITPEGIKKAMNSLVGPAIYINNVEIVSSDFHARFDVKKKVYEYIINLGSYDAIHNDYLYNYNRDLDIKAMKKAAKYLIGAHSFKAFTSGERDSYNSIIYDISFTRKKDILYVQFTGLSFYRYMVRNLVGALILVGSGKISPIGIEEMLKKEQNIYNYMTVPASGLYLKKIEY